ncbi:hypothetical protein, partial [Mesorhizobium carmichaelinearum]|uniref:hypothetical protein n=1 Tax=Mesorhizobium carmichaelinearum TaxID=1208188 RepID=UPI001AEC8D63
GDLETRYFSTARGHIGGNRMSKKQEAIGRTVAPFGAFEDVVPALEGFVRTYNHTAQGKKSALKGLSPEATFRKYLEAGWAPTAMSRDEVRGMCANRRAVGCSGCDIGRWPSLDMPRIAGLPVREDLGPCAGRSHTGRVAAA